MKPPKFGLPWREEGRFPLSAILLVAAGRHG